MRNLLEMLRREGDYEICSVCRKSFTAGTGVLGDSEGMEELSLVDQTVGPIEFCSQDCKDKYYRAGRE